MYSLIIVDYNTLDTTISHIERCWKALGPHGASHVVIVENGSGNGALDLLCQHYGCSEQMQIATVAQQLYCFQKNGQQIIYCLSDENMGYGRGNNLGALIAQELWTDPYYIFSNNDLLFEKPFDLEICTKIFKDNARVGIIGPRVLTPAGELQSPHRWISAFRRLFLFIWIWAIGGALTKERRNHLFRKYCDDMCYDAITGPYAWVSGCFMIVRACAFHEIEMFDPHTFLYAEELIISRRMETAGYSVWFCSELEIIHKHAQTTKNTLSAFRMLELDFNSIWYYYNTYTNTPKFLLTLAKWNFAVYKSLLPLWTNVKKLLHRNREDIK